MTATAPLTIGTESDLWEHHIEAAPELAGWFMERFETRSRPGVPDLYCGAGARRLWVELKVADGPIPWRKGQLGWAHRASAKGERVVALVWRPALQRAEIHLMALHAHAAAYGYAPPAPQIWHRKPVEALLRAMERI